MSKIIDDYLSRSHNGDEKLDDSLENGHCSLKEAPFSNEEVQEMIVNGFLKMQEELLISQSKMLVEAHYRFHKKQV